MADGWRQNAAYSVNATIANGQQTSGAVDLKEKTLVGLATPAALTGITMTFLVASTLAGTYRQVTNEDGSTYSVTVAANKFVALNPAKFLGARFVQVKSGSAEGAARTIELLARDV